MDENIEILEFQKMIFIYNALKSGWSVKMLEAGKFEFKKSNANLKTEVFLDDYLKKFIEDNLDNNLDNKENNI